MGRKPPAFDILAWNADGTNLPGALHGQFLDIFAHNLLAKPDAFDRARHPDRARAASRCPPSSPARSPTTSPPGRAATAPPSCWWGDCTFVLSYSGHIASLVNPPGNPKAHYWAGGSRGRPPGLVRRSDPHSRAAGGSLGRLGLRTRRAEDRRRRISAATTQAARRRARPIRPRLGVRLAAARSHQRDPGVLSRITPSATAAPGRTSACASPRTTSRLAGRRRPQGTLDPSSES